MTQKLISAYTNKMRNDLRIWISRWIRIYIKNNLEKESGDQERAFVEKKLEAENLVQVYLLGRGKYASLHTQGQDATLLEKVLVEDFTLSKYYWRYVASYTFRQYAQALFDFFENIDFSMSMVVTLSVTISMFESMGVSVSMSMSVSVSMSRSRVVTNRLLAGATKKNSNSWSNKSELPCFTYISRTLL
jgi:hypothetical protein